MLEAALRFLESRPRSIGEVRRRLDGSGYRTDLVEGAIARLTDLGVLDDEAFARAWIESRDRARPRGERALRAELRQKGIDPATVDAVLEDREATAGAGDPSRAADADDAAAERLLARHAAALARIVDPRARRQRAYALIARNGFSPDIAGRLAAEAAREVE